MSVVTQEDKALLFKNLKKAFSIKERKAFISDEILEKEEITNILDDWKSTTHMSDSSLLERVKSENLTLEEFAQILKISNDESYIEQEIKKDFLPKWYEELHAIFDLLSNNPIGEVSDYSMSYAFRPFYLWVSKSLGEFMNGNQNLKKLVNSDLLIDSLLVNLETGIIKNGIRAAIFELHVSKEMGELKGETSSDRFKFFVDNFLTNESYLHFFYSEYPVLAKILYMQCSDYLNNIKEALRNLEKDHSVLKELFNFSDEKLVSIKSDLGDSHQRGKTVMRFEFESGKEVLYKPKNLGLSTHFNNLLDWFNDKNFSPQFKTYNSYTSENYAWEELVEYKNCKSESDVQNYYERLGGLIGVLYSINGVDFHSENLIAHGDSPILIDIETIFHHQRQVDENEKVAAEYKALHKINDSVLSIGLLPHLAFKSAEGRGIDLGGMSITNEPLPLDIFAIENDQTDEIKFGLKKSVINKLDQNVPILKGELIPPNDYISHILKGFNNVMDIVLENKSELLADGGILDSFKSDIIRIILRPTQYYGNFIIESTHPDYLRNWIERDKMMEKIWFTFLEMEPIPHEKNDLLNNDIPFFYSYPGSTSLMSGEGIEIKEYQKKSSLDFVKERIEAIDQKVILEQRLFIKSSIQGKGHDDFDKLDTVKCDIDNVPAYDEDMVLNEVVSIGDWLIETGIYGDFNDVTWITLDINYFDQWEVSKSGNGLYNGLSGILMFTVYLYNTTKEERFKLLSDQVVNTILLTKINNLDFKSAFFGHTSSIYALSHYKKVMDKQDSKIDEHIGLVLKMLERNIEKEEFYDLLGGSSGIIIVLLNLYEETKDASVLNLAVKYGKNLLAKKIQVNEGTAWASSDSDKLLLGGLSHGTSGIAWALFKLYEHTNMIDFKYVAEDAIKYDQSLMNKEEKNWCDLRNEEYHSHHWCNGSAGIGISRLLLNHHLVSNMKVKEEIELALETTLRNGLGHTHSLCHGDLGASELFCLAYEKSIGNQYLDVSRKIAMKVIVEKQKNEKFLTGLTNHVQIPGMFLGLSGIGYQLLRIMKPQDTPSILTLEVFKEK